MMDNAAWVNQDWIMKDRFGMLMILNFIKNEGTDKR